ncbi:hypothetical protein BVRB_038250, partial [Beta vulgaris subsp. vulgaris]
PRGVVQRVERELRLPDDPKLDCMTAEREPGTEDKEVKLKRGRDALRVPVWENGTELSRELEFNAELVLEFSDDTERLALDAEMVLEFSDDTERFALDDELVLEFFELDNERMALTVDAERLTELRDDKGLERCVLLERIQYEPSLITEHDHLQLG